MRFCMSVKSYQPSPDIILSKHFLYLRGPLNRNSHCQSLYMGTQLSEVWNWEMYCNRYWYKDMYGDSSWGPSTIEQWVENITYMWLISQLILPTPTLFSTCLLNVGRDFCRTLYNFLNCKIVLLLFCTLRHICQSRCEEILHWPTCAVIQEFQEWFSWLEWFIRYIIGIKGEDVLYHKFPW